MTEADAEFVECVTARWDAVGEMAGQDLTRLRATLAQIGRMKVVPDDVMNRTTLVAAIQIARAAFTQPEGEKP